MKKANNPVLAAIALQAEIDKLAARAAEDGVPPKAIAMALVGAARTVALADLGSPAAVAWWLKSIAEQEEADDDLAAGALRREQ